MNRNPIYCPHTMTAIDEQTGEEYCLECGLVFEDEEPQEDIW